MCAVELRLSFKHTSRVNEEEEEARRSKDGRNWNRERGGDGKKVGRTGDKEGTIKTQKMVKSVNAYEVQKWARK